MIIVKEKTSLPEGVITPDMHEGNVCSLLKQARISSDDIYIKSYLNGNDKEER
jgi:hypothetical protein